MSLNRSPKLYQVSLVQARELRKRPTPSEKRLWHALRSRRLGAGWKFLRQRPIPVELDGKETYAIADFYCAEAKLVVEVDGPVHEGLKEQDAKRDKALRERGYGIMRVSVEDVDRRMPEVLARLTHEIQCRIDTLGSYGSKVRVRQEW